MTHAITAVSGIQMGSYMRCNTLQHIATRCNTMKQTAVMGIQMNFFIHVLQLEVFRNVLQGS